MSAHPTTSASIRAPSRGQLWFAVTAAWAFVALAVTIMTTVGQALKTGQVEVLTRIIWDAGWIGWAPLTFLIFALCRRYPIERHRKAATVFRLAYLGIGVVLLQMSLDWICISTLGKLLQNQPVTSRTFLFVAIYKGHLYYGVYWMLVGAAHALEYHRRFRESELLSSQLETRLADAQLESLKAQLQPHFLFNTHNTIVSLMLKKENEAAIQMLTRLSDLLRIALSRSGQQIVTVHDELNAIHLYLDIQRERFRDRLNVNVQAPDELADAEIPHLLLQPLVENAFRHGLEDVADDARLDLVIARDGDQLVCTVRDNGRGFDPTRKGVPSPGGNGIGLANTRERLRQLYGAQQSLSLEPVGARGCAVTVRLPYRVRARAESTRTP